VREIFLENISDVDVKYQLFYQMNFEPETGGVKSKR
jgi:hypothetical protein